MSKEDQTVGQICLKNGTLVDCVVQRHPHADTLYIYNVNGGVVSDVPPSLVFNSGETKYYVAEPGDHPETEAEEVSIRLIRGVFSHGRLTNNELPLPKAADPQIKLIPWPSIESFSHLVKSMQRTIQANPVFNVMHRGKLKLHGSNASVQVLADGTCIPQSRQNILNGDNTLFNFSTWVHTKKFGTLQPCVIFGEWCGRGIHSAKDAICQIFTKQFCVFGIYSQMSDICTRLIYEPEEISNFLGVEICAELDIHVLPWVTGEISLNIDIDPEEVNEAVQKIGARDDWVYDTFGITGPGEGIVMYPVSFNAQRVLYLHEFTHFAYKAKVNGHGHQVKTQKKPAEAVIVNPETVDDFLRMFVTDARCEQAVTWHLAEWSKAPTLKQFITWMCNDIKKESKDELCASGLSGNWDSVETRIKRVCFEWFQTHHMGK